MAKTPAKPVKKAVGKKPAKAASTKTVGATKPATTKAKTTHALKAVPAPTLAQSTSLELLKRLSETVAVSGDEGAVRRTIREVVTELADEVTVDTIGNLYAIKHGPARAPRVLFSAHMDEIGFMIVGVDGDGLLKFEAVGGVDDRILLGKPVWVGEARVPGVIGMKPFHLVKGSERDSVVKIDSLRIDVGATSREGAGRMAHIGDRATFATPFIDLGPTLRGKALDDRAGCTTLIELLKGRSYPVELICAFTVQEEVGLRGAKVAAFTTNADAAIAVDCTPANDLPTADEDDENIKYNTRLGLGPAIYIHDTSTIHDKRLIKHITSTAAAKGLPYQFRQPGGGGTDAAALQRSRAGVAVVSVSVPGRYLHSPAALISTADFHNTARLLRAALENWDVKVLKR
jgi:tetrahedral aminopeptidase